MAKNQKFIREQKKYQNLQKRYEEMKDFVHYKKMDEEFSYFREHAHEDENSELPFPYLVL